MDPKRIEALLVAVQGGALSPAEALERLRLMPGEDLGEAVLDHHRTLRAGAPEVILGEWKTAEQIARLLAALAAHGSGALATRVSPEKAAHVLAAVPGAQYRELARAVVVWPPGRHGATAGTADATAGTADAIEAAVVAVVCAGTSDLPVAEEAVVTLEFLGHPVTRVTDVGVAGLHRLFPHLERLRQAAVILVVAGMEGALPSVIAGLVHRPVIAVPTSVGYGVSQGGYAALLGMLSSCAAGVLVVNIDNGFGAAVGAARICGSMT
jgi:NCAIR mutase (PurE)-related protein